MAITTDDLFKIIGQKEARISELAANFALVQQSNIQLQEEIAKLKQTKEPEIAGFEESDGGEQ